MYNQIEICSKELIWEELDDKILRELPKASEANVDPIDKAHNLLKIYWIVYTAYTMPIHYM